MKRLLACLALCASLSASAQDDNCTILGVQELTLAYQDLNASIDSITQAIVSIADTLYSISQAISQSESNASGSFSAIEYVVARDIQHVHGWISPQGCVSSYPTSQEFRSPSADTILARLSNGWNLLSHEVIDQDQQGYYQTNCPGSGQVFYPSRLVHLTFSQE